VTVSCFGNRTFHPVCDVPFSFFFIQTSLSHSVFPIGPLLCQICSPIFTVKRALFLVTWCGLFSYEIFLIFLGTFTFSQKVPIGFVLSICPSACIKLVSTGHIFVKLDIGYHCYSLSRKSKFG